MQHSAVVATPNISATVVVDHHRIGVPPPLTWRHQNRWGPPLIRSDHDATLRCSGNAKYFGDRCRRSPSNRGTPTINLAPSKPLGPPPDTQRPRCNTPL